MSPGLQIVLILGKKFTTFKQIFETLSRKLPFLQNVLFIGNIIILSLVQSMTGSLFRGTGRKELFLFLVGVMFIRSDRISIH